MILLDANIVLRFVLNNDPVLSPKSKNIIQKIQSGKTTAYLYTLALSEIIFTLEGSYRLPKEQIVKTLSTLFNLPNIKVENHQLLKKAFNYYLDKNVNFPDAYYIALMSKKNIKEIYSFDRDFDKCSEITRLET
ncbi:PIN domain-containing protein [Patescibacteria group bacterium]|nr:PIN domain-containing protein [Patescibacteria group bacterium]